MKKTIMLAAVASTLVSAIAEAVEPLYSWTWTKDGLETTGGSVATSLSNIFAYTAGNEYATVGNSNRGGITLSNIGDDFTLSFDLKYRTTPDNAYRTLVAIGSSTGSLQLQYTGTGLTLYNMNSYGLSSNTNTNPSVGATPQTFASMTDWVNICIVSDVSNTKTLTLYVDGVSVGSLDNWGPSENSTSDDYSPNGLAFGRDTAGNRVFNGTADINNIKFYDSAVAPAAVPEPATATLSLLALAGLAARRRRR